jgi:hypothetical protein
MDFFDLIRNEVGAKEEVEEITKTASEDSTVDIEKLASQLEKLAEDLSVADTDENEPSEEKVASELPNEDILKNTLISKILADESLVKTITQKLSTKTVEE